MARTRLSGASALFLPVFLGLAACGGGGGGGSTPNGSISRVTPAAGTSVAALAAFRVVFAVDVDPASVDERSFLVEVESSGAGVDVTVSYDAGSRTATASPLTELVAGAYRARITDGIALADGGSIEPFAWVCTLAPGGGGGARSALSGTLPTGSSRVPLLWDVAVADSGEAVVAWNDGTWLMTNRFDPSSGSWSQPRRMTSDPIVVEGPADLAVAPNGRMVLVYVDNPLFGAASHVMQSTREPGGEFGAPVRVAENVAADGVRVALNEAGRIVVVWRTENDETFAKVDGGPARELRNGDSGGFDDEARLAVAETGLAFLLDPFQSFRLGTGGDSWEPEFEEVVALSPGGTALAATLSGGVLRFKTFAETSGWSATATVALGEPRGAELAAVIGDDGDLALAWRGFDAQGVSVARAVRRIGGAWGPIDDLGPMDRGDLLALRGAPADCAVVFSDGNQGAAVFGCRAGSEGFPAATRLADAAALSLSSAEALVVDGGEGGPAFAIVRAGSRELRFQRL